jgi:hypothetical protein
MTMRSDQKQPWGEEKKNDSQFGFVSLKCGFYGLVGMIWLS